MWIKQLLVPSLNRRAPVVRIPECAPGDAIPRILHQTFYERKLSGPLQQNVDRLRAMNPGWEYRFYDDEDIAAFIRQHYPPVVWDYFQRINPAYGAARADLFRYLLMYKVGGVYLDIKSSAACAFDTVIEPGDRFIISQWHTADRKYDYWGMQYDVREVPGGEFQQWHIMCAPGHPFMKEVVESVLSNIQVYDPYLHETGKPGVLRLTGPSAFTLAIDRIRHLHPHRMVAGHDRLGLDYNIFSNAERSHVQVFRSHYSLQTSSIVRLAPFKRVSSQAYRLAQYLHGKLRQRAA